MLGLFLGDGCLSLGRRGVWKIRIVLDARYPAIINECCTALQDILPTNRVGTVVRDGCVEIYMHWKHWPALFPTGPGKKHERKIVLEEWQLRLIERHPGPFLRGLIHSDGCRIIAFERQSGRTRTAPRYVLSNLSDDIKDLFCWACDLVGVRWTRPGRRVVNIYRSDSVRRLDEFVGPKA